MTARTFGFAKLAEQVADHLASEWEWMSQPNGCMIGESPIEKLLLQALTIRCEVSGCEFSDLRIANSGAALTKEQKAPRGIGGLPLIIWPQARIGSRRVDFLVTGRDYRTDDKWRVLLVECDGHNFHERTKEQAAKDRSKDRAATLAGYDCFRFTGSEIWRDPWGCAEQITDWAAKGLW
jgi:very-short-patch-repair endonuclease